MGDYLDPYGLGLSRNFLLNNLKEMIKLKHSDNSGVTLLLGNHDVHYFVEDANRSSRFDAMIAAKASEIFRDNIGCFQYAYQEDNRIFTHAGIAHKWFVDDFKGDLTGDIAEQLNHPIESQLPSLYRVGCCRGGHRGDMGGIFWADISELTDPLHGFTQIVGHNRVPEIIKKKYADNNKIVFCDSLFNDNYFLIEE
jgi:hypothetical protein